MLNQVKVLFMEKIARDVKTTYSVFNTLLVIYSFIFNEKFMIKSEGEFVSVHILKGK
jgi:hypothetical protein